MSTPLVDIPLPYGVTVESEQGDRMMKTIGNDPRVGNISLGLTAGPCRVAASYRGPEEAVLQLVNGNSVTQLATIPAGGGHAPSWSPSVRASGTESVSISAHPQREESPVLSRCTRSRPSPAGGGVGGADHGACRRAVRGGKKPDHEAGVPHEGQPDLRVFGGRGVRRDCHVGWYSCGEYAPQVGRLNGWATEPHEPRARRSDLQLVGCGAASGNGARRVGKPGPARVLHHQRGNGRPRPGHYPNNPRQPHPGYRGGNLVAGGGWCR